MRHIRMIGLCIVAVFAASAVVAATASAAPPEWGGCEATVGGKYSDSACTVKAHPKAGGTYEWYTNEQFGTVFGREEGRESPLGIKEYNFEPIIGPTTFETTGKIRIECVGGFGLMRLEAQNTADKILIALEGCSAEGEPCRGEFQGPGEISNEISWFDNEGFAAKLVYIAGKGGMTPTVGLELTTFKKREHLFTVVCDGPIGTVEVGGSKKEGNSIISVITPVDTMTTEYTQQFSQSEPGIQSPNARENGHKEALQEFFGNTNKWERSAWTSTFADPAEGGAPPTEIRAIK